MQLQFSLEQNRSVLLIQLDARDSPKILPVLKHQGCVLTVVALHLCQIIKPHAVVHTNGQIEGADRYKARLYFEADRDRLELALVRRVSAKTDFRQAGKQGDLCPTYGVEQWHVRNVYIQGSRLGADGQKLTVCTPVYSSDAGFLW